MTKKTEQKDRCDIVGAIIIAVCVLKDDHPDVAQALRRAANDYFDLEVGLNK